MISSQSNQKREQSLLSTNYKIISQEYTVVGAEETDGSVAKTAALVEDPHGN